MTEIRKEVTVTRVVSAPRERVFRAWTDPDLVVQWWGPRGFGSVECEIDLRVGGAFRIVMVGGDDLSEFAGQRSPVRCVYTEVDPPARLAFTDEALDDDGTVHLDGVTTVVFDDLGDGTTRVTVHATAEGRTPQSVRMLEGMHQGWTESLDKLAEFAGRGPVTRSAGT